MMKSYLEQQNIDKKEYQRIKRLSEFDLDYSELQKEFKNLVKLAANIAGTEISVINLIDNYTQWSVSSYRMELFQTPREDSICDHTIRHNGLMEINRLDKDERFMARPYVQGDNGLTYYLGIPLTLDSGENIGALCVLDRKEKALSENTKNQLHLISLEIISRLENKKKQDKMGYALAAATKVKNQLAHDVRGPIQGIIGLAELVEDEEFPESEMLSYFEMIRNSGNSLLELTDDILSKGPACTPFKSGSFNLDELKARLENLYLLTAHSKHIDFKVTAVSTHSAIRFSKRKLLSIAGNLISNAIKFTPSRGEVYVELDISSSSNTLKISVKDSGRGIPPEVLEKIELEKNISEGTMGEKGFGLGLKLVHEMVMDLGGRMKINSPANTGTFILVEIPLG